MSNQLIKSLAKTPAVPICPITAVPSGNTRGALSASRRERPCSTGRKHTLRNRNMNHPVVLITGALTGIGRAAAIAFARKGAKVVVSGRRDEAGNALVKELRALGS